jgi:hypothetical protein
VVWFVEAPLNVTCSAVLAEGRRSVLMKGVARQFHPRILRFGNRIVAGAKTDLRHDHGRWVACPDPRRARQPVGGAAHDIRRVFFDEL